MSLYQGQIFQISPGTVSQGDTLTLTIPGPHPAQFRTTSNHRAYLVPERLPPGIPASTTFFGYQTGFTRIDDKHATVVVPTVGTDPLREVTPGRHRVMIITGLDFADSAAFDVVAAPATSSPRGGTGLGIPPFANPFLSATSGSPGGRSWKRPTGIIPAAISSPRGTGFSVGTLPVPNPASATGPTGNPAWVGPMVTSANPTPATSGASAATSATPAATATTAGGGAPVPAFPQAEGLVQWLVESLSPVREGAAVPLLGSSELPAAIGQVPVSKGEEPIRLFDVIVSARLCIPDSKRTPIPHERLTFEIEPPDSSGSDDSRIHDVSADFGGVEALMKQGAAPTGTVMARTNSDGKVFCWFRLRLTDEKLALTQNDLLKSIRVVFGEPSPIDADVASTSSTGGGGGGAVAMAAMARAGGGSDDWWFGGLIDILVEPLVQVVETGIEIATEGYAYARAAIARTWQQVIGFSLKRLADGILVMGPLAPFAGQDQARGAVIGFLLGIPRGLWVMARDQVDDFKTIAVDLPRAVYDFFAEDPKFALQILGAVANPVSGIVTYALDDDFANKINGAFSRFAESTGKVIDVLSRLLPHVIANPGQIIDGVARMFYSSFDDFVGSVATDYLDWPKNDAAHTSFVLGFIAGDFAGYILGTIGFQLLLAWLTAGVGNVITGMTKLARIGGWVAKLVAVYQKISSAIGAVARQMGMVVKQAVGRVLLVVLRFIEEIGHGLADVFFELLAKADEVAERLLKALLKHGDTDDPKRITAICRGLDSRGPNGPHAPQDAEVALKILADAVEDGHVLAC